MNCRGIRKIMVAIDQKTHQKQTLISHWRESRLITDENVLKAFEEVPRELFVDGKFREHAYADAPLPLLRQKTISQPTTVMLMTQLLELKQGEKVFEIGSGSGYQAAIIAKIVGEKGMVHTTEVIPELVVFARANLANAGIKNVKVIEADGSRGLDEGAPFDKIIITAACKEFPKKLIEQLKEGGIIVGPVGNRNEQEMVKGIKQGERLALEFYGPFLFTPMYGDYGFEV